MAEKRTCPVTREQLRTSKDVELMVNGQSRDGNGRPIIAETRRSGFSTGSEGYYYSGKVLIDVAGVPTWFQMGVNLTAIGSKELPPVEAAS